MLVAQCGNPAMETVNVGTRGVRRSELTLKPILSRSRMD